ncbi:MULTISPECIES: hypothetical protein [unclassified Legionella]|uniref:hypothetical protein n=1 Tax=unclassified Legionella TaxID=2622702 RepID=UPI0010548133|nr:MULTISPECIES: hypothetical protein [unclassified Legionella]MDI9818917.1 hypothetical protein [Legionella sp. PL877]
MRANDHAAKIQGMEEVKQYQLISSDKQIDLFSSLLRNPEALTNEMIQSIGKRYLALYKVEKDPGLLAIVGNHFGFHQVHVNHPFARH